MKRRIVNPLRNPLSDELSTSANLEQEQRRLIRRGLMATGVLSLLFFGSYLAAAAFDFATVPHQSLGASLKRNCLLVMGRGDCSLLNKNSLFAAEMQTALLSEVELSDVERSPATSQSEALQSLKNSGLGMCDSIEESCNQDNQSEICRIGQTLF